MVQLMCVMKLFQSLIFLVTRNVMVLFICILSCFSEEYFWDLINKRENEGKNFKSIYGDYLNKHHKSNFMLLFIVCIAPLLNILFDYFLLNEKPEIKSIILAIVCLCFPISYIVFSYRISKDLE